MDVTSDQDIAFEQFKKLFSLKPWFYWYFLIYSHDYHANWEVGLSVCTYLVRFSAAYLGSGALLTLAISKCHGCFTIVKQPSFFPPASAVEGIKSCRVRLCVCVHLSALSHLSLWARILTRRARRGRAINAQAFSFCFEKVLLSIHDFSVTSR